jgi:signal transduction histidine kinase
MRSTLAWVLACWGASIAFVVGFLGFAAWMLNPLPQVVIAIAVAVVPLSLALLIARRVPGNSTAVLLALSGFIVVTTNSIDGRYLGPLEGGWMLLYLPFAILLLVVPDGRVASRFWRAVAWAITVVVGLFMAVVAIQFYAPSTLDPLTPAAYVLLFGFLGLLIVCAIGPIVRYRRSDERQRMQLRWVFLSGASLPLTLLLCWASYLLLGAPDLVAFGLILMYLVIPAGVAVALVRPNLFDIDRAAVATVTAVALSIVVLGVLSVASGIVGVTLIDWSPVAAIATTAGLTLLAVLAYRYARRGFDRLLYPERGRAVAALTALSARVDAGEAMPEDVEATLRAALRDPGLVIGYRGLTEPSLRTLMGAPLELSDTSAPIRVRGEEIGVIAPSVGRVKRPASAVAHAAAPLVDAARTRAELGRALAEVDASRERLLLAGYEERRRLERDLHDGAQQRLVALGMRLRVLQRTGSPNSAVTDTLDAAVAELGLAVAELRQIAHGVRPSALDDGLGSALADLVRLAPDTIQLDVEATEIPDGVATTAYYVVSEAITNALRHAAASRISVVVREDDASLRVRIADDGCGGALTLTTGGLTGLADRVDAIGGRLTVDSPPGGGTIVEALLPCG